MSDKSIEYQQVAALTCMDIDTVCAAAESQPEMALELLLKLREMKNKLIDDEDHRKMRFNASMSLFNAISRG